MYTGIVAGTAPVVEIKDGDVIRSFTINLDGYIDGLQIGASVALDGVDTQSHNFRPIRSWFNS